MNEDNYHFREDFVICPHCNYAMNDTEEMLSVGEYSDENLEDGAQWEMKCPSCHKDIYVETTVTHEYSTYQNEDCI